MAENNKTEQLRNLMYDVFNTEKGKEMISLLVDHYVFKVAYAADVNKTHVNIGIQQVVLELWQASQVSPAEIRGRVEEFNRREVQ